MYVVRVCIHPSSDNALVLASPFGTTELPLLSLYEVADSEEGVMDHTHRYGLTCLSRYVLLNGPYKCALEVPRDIYEAVSRGLVANSIAGDLPGMALPAAATLFWKESMKYAP
jgi:hypothetical protein